MCFRKQKGKKEEIFDAAAAAASGSTTKVGLFEVHVLLSPARYTTTVYIKGSLHTCQTAAEK